MKFFKPEDCSKYLAKIFDTYCKPDGKGATQLASLLNEQLEREGKVVYGTQVGKHWRTELALVDVNQALLIAIEPIEKCEHPEEKLTVMASRDYRIPVKHNLSFLCECGARVKPTKFEE